MTDAKSDTPQQDDNQPTDTVWTRGGRPCPPQQDGELEALIEKRVKAASLESKSDDPIVRIAWLARGIDVWHRSGEKMGNSPAKAQRYIISSVTKLLAAESAKAYEAGLIAEAKTCEAAGRHNYKRAYDAGMEAGRKLNLASSNDLELAVLAARLQEVETALTEYNRLQEQTSEPSRDLNYGNRYLLKRHDKLKAEQTKLEHDGTAADTGGGDE